MVSVKAPRIISSIHGYYTSTTIIFFILGPLGKAKTFGDPHLIIVSINKCTGLFKALTTVIHQQGSDSAALG
jgi:hypothetical protein